MTPNALPARTSGEAKRGTTDPLLCLTCRLEVEAEIWTLVADVRRALLSVSRGGGTGLVLHHFDDALHGMARLAGYQQQGVLGQPPDVDALRCRLVGQRYSVVSWAIAVRTSPPHCPPSRPEALARGRNAFHAPVIGEVLGQLAALQQRPSGGGSDEMTEHRFSLAAGSAERRGEPRSRVRCPVLVSPGERGGTAIDLSRGGIGCQSDQPLAAGTGVWVTFCRRCRLEVEGVVRWSSASIAGVQFRTRLSETSVGEFTAAGCAA